MVDDRCEQVEVEVRHRELAQVNLVFNHEFL